MHITTEKVVDVLPDFNGVFFFFFFFFSNLESNLHSGKY